jgi:hypothetical protein
MFEERLAHLLECWKKAFGQYENLKTEAERAVVRWQWTRSERYSNLPFYFERFPGRGRVLKYDPGSEGSFIHYGFDEQDRVRIKQSYSFRLKRPAALLQKFTPQPGLSGELYSETFYRYTPEQIESIEFSVPPHIPLDIQHLSLENDRVVFYAGFRLNGYTPLYGIKGKNPDDLYEWLGVYGRFKTGEAYSYDQTRLNSISGYYEVPGIPAYSAQEQFTYNEHGKLLNIDRFYANGQKQVIYRERRKGQTFQAMRAEATQKLVEAIVQRVKAANIQETVYCIELYYQKWSGQFPPAIIPVPESYRLKLIQSADPGARTGIFLPTSEKDWFFQINDPQTLEMCRVLAQEIQRGEKWNTATRILRDVAAALTLYDWSHILTVTPDFVVYALDPEMEGDQLVEVLSSSVSNRQIQEWINKGWLFNR